MGNRIVRSTCPFCSAPKAKHKPANEILKCTRCSRTRPAPAYLPGVTG